MSPKHYTDEELMMRLQAGDKKCFEMLYERYHIKLYNFLLRSVKDSQKTEDLLHDIFIRIIEAPEKFNVNLRFSTWIYTIATNLCRNEIRNDTNRKHLLQKNFIHGIATRDYQPAQIDRMNFRKELDEFIDDMSDDNKTIFLLRFQEELSVPEISKILDYPEGTIKSRLFYMIKKMATELKAYNPAR